MSALALVNGRLEVGVEWRDRGFQYGDGVFTTLSIRAGRPLLLDRHLARLRSDSQRLGIPFRFGSEIVAEAGQLCMQQCEGILKIQITRGPGGRGYRSPEPVHPTRVLSAHPSPAYDPDLRESGVTLRMCATRLGWNAALAGIKHTNRLEQILARSEWSDERVQEGLMIDQGGAVVEGTMSNVFLVRRGGLSTPLIDRCGVSGIMRALVIEVARQDGIAVEECRLSSSDLETADAMFLTNCAIRVWPVSRLEQQSYKVGPVTRRLIHLVDTRLGIP